MPALTRKLAASRCTNGRVRAHREDLSFPNDTLCHICPHRQILDQYLGKRKQMQAGERRVILSGAKNLFFSFWTGFAKGLLAPRFRGGDNVCGGLAQTVAFWRLRSPVGTPFRQSFGAGDEPPVPTSLFGKSQTPRTGVCASLCVIPARPVVSFHCTHSFVIPAKAEIQRDDHPVGSAT